MIPADDKHYLRWQVADLINDAFAQLGVEFPRPSRAQLKALRDARAKLAAE